MTPVILTLLAAPSFASGGSGRDQRSDWDDHNDWRNDRDRGDDSYRRKRRRWD
jgi:hypothetical protein